MATNRPEQKPANLITILNDRLHSVWVVAVSNVQFLLKPFLHDWYSWKHFIFVDDCHVFGTVRLLQTLTSRPLRT